MFDPDKKARLVQFGKRLTLVRQGKIPLQKLAYQAHAYLRGAKVSFVFDKSVASNFHDVGLDENNVMVPAFSDSLLPILQQSIDGRGPTVYTYLTPEEDQVEVLCDLLNERNGEQKKR